MNPLASIVRQQKARYLAAHGKLPNRSDYVLKKYREKRNIPEDQELSDEDVRTAMEFERMNWD